MSEQENTNNSEPGVDQQKILEGLFGGLGGGPDMQEMIVKHTQGMLDEFNGMLTQIMFGLILQSFDDDKQIELKNSIYLAWKVRMDEVLAESKQETAQNSGLGQMFDVGEILSKSIIMAEENIKGFLDIDDNK